MWTELPVGGAVAEHDSLAVVQPLQGGGIGVVLALPMRDRHGQHLALSQSPGEDGVGILHSQVDALTTVLQALVAHERPRQETRLTEDLEPVARSEHKPPVRHELGQDANEGRPRRHRPCPQIVAVGKSPGQDHAVELAEVGLPVPDVTDRLVEHLGDDIVEIRVTPGTREHGHTEVHQRRLILAFRSACRNIAEDLDLVVLEDRVGQEPLAHVGRSAPRALGRCHLQVHLDHLADA